MSEKEKMLLGKPYLHYIDDVLLDDRQQCKFAIERYNNAARPSEAISSDERSRFFSAVIDPAKRNVANQNYRDVSATIPTMLRPGRIGHRTIVEAPFNCDYGYNINLGNDVVVGAGCYMQDPCEVIIGNRTIIGPNVRFYGNSASVDPTARKGSQGMLTGGAIIVEDDVFIGGDAIILPHRVIGKGAVVGAGSVVTKVRCSLISLPFTCSASPDENTNADLYRTDAHISLTCIAANRTFCPTQSWPAIRPVRSAH